MAKKKSEEEIYLPVPSNMSLIQPHDITQNTSIQNQFIREAILAGYERKIPSPLCSWQQGYGKKPKPIVSPEETELVVSLMQSLEPRDAVECALAAQFTATYIHGMRSLKNGYSKTGMGLLEFGHKVLHTLQRHRNKGIQQVQVQYNTQLNQQQIIGVQKNETLISEGQ